MKKFRIYTSTTPITSFIISSSISGLYIDLNDIPAIRRFIDGTVLVWPIEAATDMGDLLAEFDTFEELTNNYPELFI